MLQQNGRPDRLRLPRRFSIRQRTISGFVDLVTAHEDRATDPAVRRAFAALRLELVELGAQR